MRKHKLQAESLKVESFVTFVDAPIAGGTDGCVCDMAPCGCTKGPDCTQG